MAAGDMTLDKFLAGLRQTEHGVYDWVNNGAGAYGAYQILSSNWPTWANEAGVNPNDHGQAAQDAVARYKVLQYWHKYGDWRKVAASWYYPAKAADPTGWGFVPQGNSISIGDYVNRVMSNAGGAQYTATSNSTAGGGGGVSGNNSAGTGGGGPSLNMQQLYREYGAIAALLHNDGLSKLVQKAVAKGWDDNQFNARLIDTGFYKHHSDAQRNWLLLQQSDPGEANRETKQRIADIRERGAKLGVQLNVAEVQNIAHQSLFNGVTDSTLLDQMVGAHFQMQHDHLLGSAGTMEDQYRQLADAYGLPVSSQTLGGWIRHTLTGKLDPESVKAQLVDSAKTMYPGLAKQLDGGQTVADVAGYYRDSMSNILELDPSQLSWRDPAIKRALQYQSDPTKPPTLMPLYQFEQGLRNDPRWLNTNNAKQSMQDVGVQILKDFGLTA